MLEIGSVSEGKIVRIMPFGAFVEISKKNSGLVHISEISKEYVKDIADHVKIGDVVKVKVIGVDEKGRLSLSMKQAIGSSVEKKPKQEKKQKKSEENSKPVRPADFDLFGSDDDKLSFEDKLSRFKKDSDEKILALKRSAESKRSGGYSRRGGR